MCDFAKVGACSTSVPFYQKVCLLVSLAGDDDFEPKNLLSPVIFFMIGAVLGSATACTFAPGRFLRGAAWRK
ncbi:hypothetical protein [Tautonia plasticadhaerens]|uniref:Uncharacterized protein n=1 Tax=Tautonia plasticadhaerens TaxID=2527974 RepID=A0A518HEN5_9BACT|nr:hypothetical protein [Tautonia plasticadhaerens]QDV39305.1 hypothetical protein ElP_72690 [Tautonia plasticadhaerens]